MITAKDVLCSYVGWEKYNAFVEVKHASMELANAVKATIADDLGGTIPRRGKQFLTTERGSFRLAQGDNSDNTTEEGAHDRMSVRTVQVFGEPTDIKRERGVLSLRDLYTLHDLDLDWDLFFDGIEDRLA